MTAHDLAALADTDPEIAGLIDAEERGRPRPIRLIASRELRLAAVLEATGTVLTNKYSEGYAGKRYYEGQQVIDQVETLAIDRAKALFGVDHANVQPYSGSPANLAVYLALPQARRHRHGHGAADGRPPHPRLGRLGDRQLVQPGAATASGTETGRVDLDEVRDIALRERPKLIFCGGTAIPRTIDFPAFAAIAKEVGAVLVADIAHIAGLVAGGAHPCPVGYADVISTTTHKTLRGPRGAMLMCDEEHAKAIDKAVFPGLQGGPHNHTTAAHRGRAARGAPSRTFKTYARADRRQREGARRGARRARLSTSSPAAPTTTWS